MGYVSAPTDLTSKMNKLPDYDTGCFGIAASTFIEKTHNLNTRDLLIMQTWSHTDTDCSNDGTSGSGFPMLDDDPAGQVAVRISSVKLTNSSSSNPFYLWPSGAFVYLSFVI